MGNSSYSMEMLIENKKSFIIFIYTLKYKNSKQKINREYISHFIQLLFFLQ